MSKIIDLCKMWLSVEAWPQALGLLAARLYLFDVFFKSGLTKIKDWEGTLYLFNNEYHVPVLPPEWAAVMGTAGELGVPDRGMLGQHALDMLPFQPVYR